MCSLVVWKYKWEHLSVNVRDLAKETRSTSLEFKKADAADVKQTK